MGFFNKPIKLFKGSDLKNTEDRSNDPNNIKALEKRFRFFNLDSKFDQIKPLIRDQISLHLTPSAESSFVEGESKIGGMPDLPSTISWPKNLKGNSLSFIGQINLTDLSKVYLSNLLPLQGTLYFFYSAEQEAWGFDPNDKDQFSVIYDDSDAVKRRIDLPDDIDAFSRFKPNKIKFEHRLSVPGWEHPSVRNILSKHDLNNYIELTNPGQNTILGYADAIQAPMELECALVTNGLYCGDSTGYNDLRAKSLEVEADKWMCLLQVDSEDEKTGMMWGDAGKLYFWIREDDLKNKRFDKSWFCLQCY